MLHSCGVSHPPRDAEKAHAHGCPYVRDCSRGTSKKSQGRRLFRSCFVMYFAACLSLSSAPYARVTVDVSNNAASPRVHVPSKRLQRLRFVSAPKTQGPFVSLARISLQVSPIINLDAQRCHSKSYFISVCVKSQRVNRPGRLYTCIHFP